MVLLILKKLLKIEKVMEKNNIEKIYFIPGDLVILKHDLDNKPIMLVTEIVTSKILNPSYLEMAGYTQINEKNYKNHFRGIRCGWFDMD